MPEPTARTWRPVLLSVGTPAGAVVVVCTASVVPAGSVAAGSTNEPERPAAGGIAPVWAGAEPLASGTVVAAAAGASVGTAAGAVGAGLGPVKNAGAVDDPPLHAVSAASAKRMGPSNAGPERGIR